MKRWGLRWIFCWLSVIITAACGQFSSPTPTQENTDQKPTLQNFLPPPTASPLPPIRPLHTATPMLNARLATLDPSLDILVEAPICYETAVQSLICLGWIQNRQDTPVSNTLITIYLLTAQGETLTTVTAQPALTVIAGQAGVPYRAIFNESPDTAFFPYADLLYGEAAQPDPTAAVVLEETQWADDHYQIKGIVEGDGVQQVRVVLTIRNDDGYVTAFRTILVDLDEERATFNMRVAPLDGQPGIIEVSSEVIP